jgi:hypothetical protein
VSHLASSGGGIESALSSMQWLVLALRGVMETGIVVGLAFWGARTGSSTIEKVALAIGAPVLLFGFWGLVDFRQAGRAAEPLRLVQELVISGLASLAVWVAGQPLLGVLLALVSIVYHGLVYATGGRLLRADPAARTGRAS